jgi:hypothetical protein
VWPNIVAISHPLWINLSISIAAIFKVLLGVMAVVKKIG